MTTRTKNPWFFTWLAQAQDALRQKKINANTFAVLVVLSQFTDYDTGRNARPGLDRLSKDTGLSPRTVSGALKVGETAGLIHKDRRGFGNAGAGSASVYSMHTSANRSHTAVASATAPAIAPARKGALPSSDPATTKKTKNHQGTGKSRTVRRPKPKIDWESVGLTQEIAHQRGLTEVEYRSYVFLLAEQETDA